MGASQIVLVLKVNKIIVQQIITYTCLAGAIVIKMMIGEVDLVEEAVIMVMIIVVIKDRGVGRKIEEIGEAETSS